MRRDFLHYEQAFLTSHPSSPPPSTTRHALPLAFPIERARLRQVPWMTAVLALSTALYGFSVAPVEHSSLPHLVSQPGWLAVPLALQFLMAASSNAIFAINTTLITDLYPGSGAGATAINNLVRCGVAAGGVAGVEAMLARLGPGHTFLVLAALVVAMSVLLAVEWYGGMRCRAARETKRGTAERSTGEAATTQDG